jgi:hemoglobin-like flavoprotein
MQELFSSSASSLSRLPPFNSSASEVCAIHFHHFAETPLLNPFFAAADADPLYESPQLRRHASTVMRTVGQAVAGLKDVHALVPVLKGLGAAHAKYGVQPAHFAVIGEALLWTLERGLGTRWTPEVRDAWSRTYSVVQSVMEPALIEAAAIMDSEAQKRVSQALVTLNFDLESFDFVAGVTNYICFSRL